MKRWIELTDEYVKKLRDGARRKIRTQAGQEVWTIWIKREQCFYSDPHDCGFYMDEPYSRPTHVLIG